MFGQNPFRTNYSFFFFESSESCRVFNNLQKSNTNFRAGRIISEGFSGGTVLRTKRINAFGLGREKDGGSSFVNSSEGEEIRRSRSCLAAARTCSGARTGKDGRKPENEEVSLRHILKYPTRGGSDIFRLFDTVEKKGPLRGKQKTMVGESGKKATKQESWQNEWHDFKYQGVWRKFLRAQRGP